MRREAGPSSSDKIAAFDFVRPSPTQQQQSFLQVCCGVGAPHTISVRVQDGTLVQNKSMADFATSADDWKLYNAEVPKVLKQHYDDGYKIVVFRYPRQAATAYGQRGHRCQSLLSV